MGRRRGSCTATSALGAPTSAREAGVQSMCASTRTISPGRAAALILFLVWVAR